MILLKVHCKMISNQCSDFKIGVVFSVWSSVLVLNELEAELDPARKHIRPRLVRGESQ